MIAHVKIAPTVSASVGKNTVVRGRNVAVAADNTVIGKVTGIAAGGGLLSGQGLDIKMEVDPTTSVVIDQGAQIAATQSVSAISTSTATSSADGQAGNYGGVVVIIGGSTSTLKNINSATVGNNAVISGGSTVTVRANSSNTASATGDGGGGALVAVVHANTVNQTDRTHVDRIIGQPDRGHRLSVRRATMKATSKPDVPSGLGADTRPSGSLTFGAAPSPKSAAARLRRRQTRSAGQYDAQSVGGRPFNVERPRHQFEARMPPSAGQFSTSDAKSCPANASLFGDNQVNIKAHRLRHEHGKRRRDHPRPRRLRNTSASMISTSRRELLTKPVDHSCAP